MDEPTVIRGLRHRPIDVERLQRWVAIGTELAQECAGRPMDMAARLCALGLPRDLLPRVQQDMLANGCNLWDNGDGFGARWDYQGNGR